MIRSNDNIKKLNILNFEFLLSAYADDTTFFLADINSINITFATFDKFSIFSGMKINQSKCEYWPTLERRGVSLRHSVVLNLFYLLMILYGYWVFTFCTI